MTRAALVVANWKMNMTATQAAEFAARLRPLLAPVANELATGQLEIAVAPPFPALERLGRALAGSGVVLAAQDVHEAESGAFTGEVARAMLDDLDCRYVLIGHSERRQHFGDDEARVVAKLERVLTAATSGLRAILCVGETLAEREAGRLTSVLARQLSGPLALIQRLRAAGTIAPEARLALAYEPVWAIGTGRVATPEIAQAAHAEIRRILVERLGSAGAGVRILYGGSVKASNAKALLAENDIDGALVGGASLDPTEFAEIVACRRPFRMESVS